MRYPHAGSYIPVLSKLINMTIGPILELGCGAISTPYLHWMCYANKRRLVSVENNPKLYPFTRQFRSDFHEIHNIPPDGWDQVNMDRPWSIAFVDHAPAERRVVDLQRLRHSEYVVVHDSEDENDRHYHLSTIDGIYRYRYRYEDAKPNTTIYSMRRPFDNFTVGYDAPPPLPSEIKMLSDLYMRRASTYGSDRRAKTICMALGEIYVLMNDEEIKKKLRYAATLSQYLLWKMKEFCPQWLKDFYPTGKDYADMIQKISKEEMR